MDHAGVVLVTLAVRATGRRDCAGAAATSCPKPVQRTVTAASFGSQKWAHWQGGDGEVLRVSLGRDGLPVDHLDDDEALARAVDEVGAHLGIDLQPTATRVSRWPGAFPQYRPHHQRWLAAVDASLPPGLFLTGASYGGIGVPACIAQARAAAARAAAHAGRRRDSSRSALGEVGHGRTCGRAGLVGAGAGRLGLMRRFGIVVVAALVASGCAADLDAHTLTPAPTTTVDDRPAVTTSTSPATTTTLPPRPRRARSPTTTTTHHDDRPDDVTTTAPPPLPEPAPATGGGRLGRATHRARLDRDPPDRV